MSEIQGDKPAYWVDPAKLTGPILFHVPLHTSVDLTRRARRSGTAKGIVGLGCGRKKHCSVVWQNLRADLELV